MTNTNDNNMIKKVHSGVPAQLAPAPGARPRLLEGAEEARYIIIIIVIVMIVFMIMIMFMFMCMLCVYIYTHTHICII